MMTTYATLCYIIKDGKGLLLKKAKGLWEGDFYFDERAERLITYKPEVIEA